MSSALEFYTGAAYNITPEWSIGAELDNERGYDGLILGGSPAYAENAYFAGPTIQYVGHPVAPGSWALRGRNFPGPAIRHVWSDF